MTTVLLFHHAQGLTDGVRWFADQLRDAGHEVTTPDLYDGRTYETLEEGAGHAASIGFENIADLGIAAAGDLPDGVVVIGFSLGALPAQKLAQTRAGVRGAVLAHSGIPSEALGGPWPAEVALQVHASADDPVLDPGEFEVARALAEEAADGTFYAYPGEGHLIADNSLDSYDAESAALILDRTKEFLARLA